jgi:hypothetical protein
MALIPVAEGDPHVPAHNEEREAINDLEENVASRIFNPTIKNVGSMLRWDGDDWVASKMRIFEGTGSPEGVIAAPTGSRYVDTTNASGIAEYLKASGSGNTGWIPLNTATPWTNVTPSTGWAHTPSKAAQVCMLNGVIYARGSMRRNSGTSVTMGSVNSQFAQAYANSTMYGFTRVSGETAPMSITLSPTGVFTISGGYDTGDDVYFESISFFPFKRT